MLEILQQKLLSWNPEQANSFHNNRTNRSKEMFSNCIWETAPTGVFVISPEATIFHDYNGQSHYLVVGDHTDSLQQKIAMSQYAEDNGLTRIEKPIEIQLVQIYQLVYTYSKEVSPYGSQGISYDAMLLVPEEQLEEAYVEVTKQFLKGMDDIYTCIKNIPDAKYPEWTNMHLFKFDPQAEKFFISGVINFEQTLEEYTSGYDAPDQLSLTFENYLSTRFHVQDCSFDFINYVETECSTLKQII